MAAEPTLRPQTGQREMPRVRRTKHQQKRRGAAFLRGSIPRLLWTLGPAPVAWPLMADDHTAEPTDEGVGSSADEIIAEVYANLRRIAGRAMQGEAVEHTLQPTAVAHEAYLKLRSRHKPFESKAAFYAASVGVIREILADHARRKRTQKRSHKRSSIDLARLAHLGGRAPEVDLIDLEDALQKLKTMDARHEHVASLILFGGCTFDETARMIGVDRSTVTRHWTAARAFLRRELLP